MASTTCLISFSSSASPFIGSKVSTNQSHSPPPSRVSFRPLRVSAACATTAERPTSYIATPTSASSLYEVLGIQMGATCQEIKTAYRRLARILHPDVAANGQREDTAYEFMRVHEAYETLSDPEKRADYDLSLYRRGRQMGSPFVMSAATVTTMATGFSGYTNIPQPVVHGPRIIQGCSASKKQQLLAMARLIRQWPFLRNHCFCHAAFNYLLSECLILSIKAISPRLSLTIVTASNRSAHFRSRGPEKTSDFGQGGNASDSDSESYKSRKQKKREARLAVRCGMELASFSPPQIKRIIKVASLEKDVFDALIDQDRMCGKESGGNIIISKMVIGVGCSLQGFSGLEEKIIGDGNEESGESEYDVEEEAWGHTIYALRSIDLTELHKHVRRMHEVQERKGVAEEIEQELETAITAAKKSLARFLHGLDKQMPSESNHIDL
ncbi:hypothetical protein NC651_004939 [Populus alba x Populus x berolinensis]|nr:hypothetical protein NC651_004939 [Populus alba x Populus x berolinensis]